MTHKPDGITAHHAQQLMELAESIPDAPVGPHLTEEEFACYGSAHMSPADTDRVDLHLVSCEQCLRELEELNTMAEVWEVPEGRARLARLAREIFGDAAVSVPGGRRSLLTRVARSFDLGLSMRLPLAFADKSSEIDRTIAVYGHNLRIIIREKNHDLLIRFGSHALGLEGKKVRLTSPGFERDVTLNRVINDQVGAKIVITQDERKGLQPGTLTVSEVPETTLL